MSTNIGPASHDVSTFADQIRAHIPGADVDLLLAHRFDLAAFLSFRRAVRSGVLTPLSSLYRGPIAPPQSDEIVQLPPPESAEARELEQRGQIALAAGEVAVVVVAGGMATRFGGGGPPVVKGSVEVIDGKSFIELKLDNAREVGRRVGRRLPFCVMGSFATLPGPQGLERHLSERRLLDDDVRLFSQSISVRLTPEGAVFGAAPAAARALLPRESYATPGHGDFFPSLRATGVLRELRASGVKTLLFSNVDNLGATVDATLIGLFLQRRESGVSMLAETVTRTPADGSKVGVVVRADGALCLLEGFRVPDDVDQRALTDVSINTFLFDLEALDRNIPLQTHAVIKAIGGRAALQAETITGEATSARDDDGRAILPWSAVHVRREGGPGDFFAGRFYPVKTREDLEPVRRLLAAATRAAPKSTRPAPATTRPFARERESDASRIARLQAASTTLRDGGVGEPRFFSAPGRINLMGEHTDYNEGLVLPAAIDRGIVAWVRPRADDDCVLFSLEVGAPISFTMPQRLEQPGFTPTPTAALHEPGPSGSRADWSRYARGVIDAFAERGLHVGGFELVLTSDLTPNSGMSSSTALCLVIAAALSALSATPLPPAELAWLAQRAEHIVGVDCGIMDQWVIAHARARHAMLLDCRSMATEHVPLRLRDCVFVVTDTGRRRSLIDSGYNRRRAECVEAVRLLGLTAGRPLASLRDVTAVDLQRHGAALPAPLRRRVRHVLDDNARVLQSVSALKTGELAHFGQLLNAAHVSLRDLFEVSCFELDTLVERLQGCGDAVLGARMMGGGFGGSVLSLVRRAAVEAVIDAVDAPYRSATGFSPTFTVVEAVDGLREITDVVAVAL